MQSPPFIPLESSPETVKKATEIRRKIQSRYAPMEVEETQEFLLEFSRYFADDD